MDVKGEFALNISGHFFARMHPTGIYLRWEVESMQKLRHNVQLNVYYRQKPLSSQVWNRQWQTHSFAIKIPLSSNPNANCSLPSHSVHSLSNLSSLLGGLCLLYAPVDGAKSGKCCFLQNTAQHNQHPWLRHCSNKYYNLLTCYHLQCFELFYQAQRHIWKPRAIYYAIPASESLD